MWYVTVQVTTILSWNIQNGKGCDGATDLARIARVARAMGEAVVLCFQEIARHDPAFGNGADQVSFGIEMRPGGHLFQINVSNGWGTTLAQLASGGIANDRWYLGFNISRKFF